MKNARIIYAGSETSADLLYLTGFFASDPFLWLEIDGKRYSIVSSMEVGRARKQTKPGTEVMTYKQAAQKWGLEEELPRNASNLILAAARHEQAWNWQVQEDFSFALYQQIMDNQMKISNSQERVSSKVSFAVSKVPFCPERSEKSLDEVEKIRHSERIAEAGLQRALDILAASTINDRKLLMWGGELLTAEILQGEINAEIARNGGHASHTIAAPGAQSADPHQIGFGPVPANMPIVFDIFPRCNATGYFGDLTRTVVKGKADAIVKKAFTAVYDAQRTAIEMLKPGITGASVHNKAAEVMENYGFMTDSDAKVPHGFIHTLGHSVGLEIHEHPGLNAKNNEKLLPGNVVTVEPGLYYPEWGGIRIEDTVAITDNGYDDLAVAKVFLEILD